MASQVVAPNGIAAPLSSRARSTPASAEGRSTKAATHPNAAANANVALNDPASGLKFAANNGSFVSPTLSVTVNADAMSAPLTVVATATPGATGSIQASDGSAHILKTLDWRSPTAMSFSPDNKYIAYDFIESPDTEDRDIFLLAADGSHVSHQLPDWFQQEIDRRAMEQGLIGSDAYLEQWRWGDPEERPESGEEIVALLVAEFSEA